MVQVIVATIKRDKLESEQSQGISHALVGRGNPSTLSTHQSGIQVQLGNVFVPATDPSAAPALGFTSALLPNNMIDPKLPGSIAISFANQSPSLHTELASDQHAASVDFRSGVTSYLSPSLPSVELFGQSPSYTPNQQIKQSDVDQVWLANPTPAVPVGAHPGQILSSQTTEQLNDLQPPGVFASPVSFTQPQAVSAVPTQPYNPPPEHRSSPTATYISPSTSFEQQDAAGLMPPASSPPMPSFAPIQDLSSSTTPSRPASVQAVHLLTSAPDPLRGSSESQISSYGPVQPSSALVAPLPEALPPVLVPAAIQAQSSVVSRTAVQSAAVDERAATDSELPKILNFAKVHPSPHPAFVKPFVKRAAHRNPLTTRIVKRRRPQAAGKNLKQRHSMPSQGMPTVQSDSIGHMHERATSTEHLVIFGICVGVPALSFFLVVSTISAMRSGAKGKGRLKLQEPRVISQMLYIPKPEADPGFLQRRIFGADLNHQFAISADLSLRAGAAIALCALCFWVPHLQWLTEQGWSMQYAVTLFAFTFWKDVGTTMQSIWCCLIGTLVPTGHCLCMFIMFPDGVADLNRTSATVFGCCNLVGFAILYSALNWHMLMRMVAMYLHSYFMMNFLDPTSTIHFAHSFSDIAMKDGLIGPLLGTIIGCTISVVCSFFPRPLSALGHAQDLVMEMTWTVGHQWEQLLAYYLGNSVNLEVETLAGEAERMRERLLKFEGLIATSWWECFDLGRPGRVRALMARLGKTCGQMHDWFQGTIDAVRCDKFSKAHAGQMLALRPELERLNRSVRLLLHRCARFAVGSEVDPPDEGRLREEIRALEQAQQELLRAFTMSRCHLYDQQGLAPEALGEHFFMVAISSYGRSVAEYAQYLLEPNNTSSAGKASHPTRTRPTSFWQRAEGGTSLLEGLNEGAKSWLDPKVVCTLVSVRNASRTLVAFLLAFYIGRFGIAGIMSNYSSTPAGVAVLLLGFDGLGGSAFVKKFARFQGVAVGTMLGQIVFALLIRCSIWGVAAGFLGVCFIEFFAFYMYFTSVSYSYTGLLIGVFAGEQMLSGCGGLEDTPWETYQALLDQVVAILCVIVADFFLAPPSPSRLAVHAYSEAVVLTRLAMQDLLLPDMEAAVSLHRDMIFSKFRYARDRGAEAAVEPRFIRTPWREDLWSTLVRRGLALAEKFVIMEYIATRLVVMERGKQSEHQRPAGEGAVRHGAIVCLLQSRALQRIGEEFLRHREEVLGLALELMLHESEAPVQSSWRAALQRLKKHCRLAQSLDLEEIIREVLSMDFPLRDTKQSGAPQEPEVATASGTDVQGAIPCSPMGAGAELHLALGNDRLLNQTSPIFLDAGEIGAFLLMLQLSIHDLDAISDAIAQAPEMVFAEAGHVTPKPIPGLVREVSGRLDEIMQRSRKSIQGLWMDISRLRSSEGLNKTLA